MSNRVLVIGGANIDFIGKCENDIKFGDSNIGCVNISFGGVGRNIAHNLKLLGLDVTFISAIGNDQFGSLLKQELIDLGVKVYTPNIENSSGFYLSIHEKDGKMALGLCDQRVTEYLTTSYLDSLDYVIDSFEYIFLDTNLSEDKLEYLLNKYQNKVFFLDTISTSKALKIKDLTNKIDYIKCNEIEAITLFGKDYLNKKTKNTIICTRGKKDIYLSSNNESVTVPVKTEEGIVNETGAGDSFFAGFIYGVINGWTMNRSINLAKECASATLKVSGAVNPKLHELINKKEE